VEGSSRDLDVVVYGATGFVGKLTALYLAEHAPAGVRVGLGGRSEDKLRQVRSELGPRAADWPLLVADSSDRAALDALVARTKVVATTVGPYAQYGVELAAACAAAGTHYADLTGEVLFMRRSIDANHEAAVASGARIVHACGFDSIPSDLGVLLLSEAAGDDPLADVTLVVRGARGGVSGGTLASMIGVLEEVTGSPEQRRIAEDPYSLSPDRGAESGAEDPDPRWIREHDGVWVAPFIMGMANSRVVRRSNALTSFAYGHRLKYRETVACGSGPLGQAKAAAMAAGTVGGVAALAVGPIRQGAVKVLPKPGTGPSEKAREKGYFKIEVDGVTESGRRLKATVAAQGDPGYKATAVMLGESALTLALDDLPGGGGVLTPATAMGDALVERLRAAGFTLTVA
jgi:short subunit dehydrogenase-like uncharacterized protein